MRFGFFSSCGVSAAGLLLLSACGQMSSSNMNSGTSDLSLNNSPAKAEAQAVPLAWEGPSHPERSQWSSLVLQVVTENFSKFQMAKDMDRFCPRYEQLPMDQQVLAWGNLFVGIAYYESSWKPTSRMQEDFSEPDSVTHLPVFSEGLLQLSYSDTKWAPFCRFDWSIDKHLSPTDPKKTILEPLTNLSCGVQIMARQIQRTGQIVLNSGVYWSVLKEGGKYQKISGIAGYVKKLSFCN